MEVGRRVGVNAVITWLLFAGCHCPADPDLPPHISAGPGAAWAEGWAPRLPVPGDLQLPAAFQVRDVHAALLRLCVLLCSGARDQAIRWSPLLSSPCASANTTPTTISLALSLSVYMMASALGIIYLPGLPHVGVSLVPRLAVSVSGEAGSVSESSVPVLTSVEDSHVLAHLVLTSLWLLQVSGVHAPQPVATQHYDPLWGYGLETPILCISWHTALGDGEATVWLTLPAHEWKPGPGLRGPARPGCRVGDLPDAGFPASTGQFGLVSHQPPPSSAASLCVLMFACMSQLQRLL